MSKYKYCNETMELRRVWGFAVLLAFGDKMAKQRDCSNLAGIASGHLLTLRTLQFCPLVQCKFSKICTCCDSYDY
jgi:hypothetical protein